MNPSRAQLVLLAAIGMTVLLLPMLTAVLQLGYHPDGPAQSVDPHPVDATAGVLERAVSTASTDVPTAYRWAQRPDAVADIRATLRPTLTALNRSMTATGTVIEVRLNRSLAAAWSARKCPGGPGRAFGGCRTSGGIVLQNRAGRVHLVGVGIDILVVGPDAEWRLQRMITVR